MITRVFHLKEIFSQEGGVPVQRVLHPLALRPLLTAIATLSVLGGSLTLAPAAWAQAVLSSGDSGAEVMRIQQRLADLGFLNSGIDGVFGELTETAVIQFQQSRGLDADGVVGPATEAELFQGISTGGGNVTTNPPASITNNLLINDPPRIAALQADLMTLGYYRTDIDGRWGAATETALRQFQQAYRIPITGIADSRTLWEVSEAVKGKNPPMVSAPSLPDLPPSLANSPAVAPPSQQSLPPNFSGSATPLPFNTQPQSSVYDGNFFPYVVVVPDRGSTTASLNKVRQFNAQAFLAGSRRGSYIHAGSYARREDAESLSARLRAQGLDARVVYRPQ